MNNYIEQITAKIKNIVTPAAYEERNDDGSIGVRTDFDTALKGVEEFPYGFKTKATKGKVTILCCGGNYDAVQILPVSSVEHAPELDEGDVAVYSEAGNFIICRNDDEGTIELNGKDNGGLINIKDLQDQLDIMSKRIDGIINAIKAGAPATGAPDSGAALKLSIVTALETIVQKENFSDIENKKVLHGNGKT